MKLRFLFMMLLITIARVAASAQQEYPVMTRSQLRPFPLIPPVVLPVRPGSDTATSRRSLTKDTYNKRYPEGVLIDAVSMGKVYRMPVDNMLCLVPDDTKTARMPVKKTSVPEQMPNAFPGRNGQSRR